MPNLLEKNNNLIKLPQIGKIVEGKIIAQARSAVFLDLGPMGTGIIYGQEFLNAKEELKKLKIGDTLVAKIISLKNEDGYIELSLSQASDEMKWEKLKQQKDNEEILKVKIISANKGGLMTEIFGLPAFLPVSQLSPQHYPRVEKGEPAKILAELQKFINQELEVKIFDLDPKEGKIILSEKAKDNEQIKEILKNYSNGEIVEGEITGVTNFGVFIKFQKENVPPLEGLIHISELDWQQVENPAEIVKVGDKVKAKIISLANNKVFLSLKALKKDPWQDLQYKKGDVIEGVVTKFNPYGAFIQITPQIQGLCHISEFGSKTKMESVLKINQKYKFQILTIDPNEHRMSLKLAE
ncbi:MAG: 30S ribosomal protein S1 [Minisyncoccales bacterium]